MDGHTVKNYITLEQHSRLYESYAFVDVPEYFADQLFIQHQVTVRFEREFKHPRHPYVVIFCKVRKKDRESFIAALRDLPNKMILFGHVDYEQFCDMWIAQMDGHSNSERSERPDESCSPHEAEQESPKGAS